MAKVLSSKTKGLFGVSASNLLSLGLSMVTSFILPLFVSVEEYAYWQLFVLYNSYIGFFVLGFNDGVHLNYATFDYGSELAKKFSSFRRFLSLMTGFETLILLAIYFIFRKETDVESYIILVVIFNLIPTAINGLFMYMNQATMRFRYYAVSCVLDKVIFTVIMAILLLGGIKKSLWYIMTFTVSRYLVIGYHFITSREVFTSTPIPLRDLKDEIIANFRNGLPLMIALIFSNSIIVGSRLLVKAKFGIATFGAYSFSLHTYVVASQFITAIASVFYPILKRYPEDKLGNAYVTLDRSSSLLSALLLLSYYPVAAIILLIYSKYSSIMQYLTFIYPVFVFQCKASLLITNVYKVRNKIDSLIVANASAVVLHLVFALAAYYLFHSVYAIAVSVLLSYGLWYYLFQGLVFKKEGWRMKLAFPLDAVIILFFVVLNTILNNIFSYSSYLTLLVGFFAFAALMCLVSLVFKDRVRQILVDTKILLKD